MVVRHCRVVVFVVIIFMLKSPFCTPFRLYLFFLPRYRRMICTIFLCNKKYRSPCSFKRKGPPHLLRFPLDREYSAIFKKERTDFFPLSTISTILAQLSFPSLPQISISFTQPCLSKCPFFSCASFPSRKTTLIFCCMLLCAVQDAQCKTEESP